MALNVLENKNTLRQVYSYKIPIIKQSKSG